MKTHSAVRLLRNQIYPTYQLYATMASTTTSPKDGLKIAVHTTLSWICDRLGEDAPERIKSAVDSGITDDVLFSMHINAGYLIDIVYLENSNVWCLQITEPDLGSNPGEALQERSAIPGRVLESDIEYRIVENTLECGFRTLVSDPEGTDKAKVYRFAVVKKLALNPEFGLKQIMDLTDKPYIIESKKDVEKVIDFWKDSRNQLPFVVFSNKEAGKKPNIFDRQLTDDLFNPLPDAVIAAMKDIKQDTLPKEKISDERLYKVDDFAVSGIGYCRTFILDGNQINNFKNESDISFNGGDIIIMYPQITGGGYSTKSYKQNDDKREEMVAEVREETHNYCRDKQLDFGSISFLSSAREQLRKETEDIKAAAGDQELDFDKKMVILENKYKDRMKEYEETIEQKDNQISRLRENISKLEEEKIAQAEEVRKAQDSCDKKIESYKEYISFLNRKLDRPDKMESIVEWAEKYFTGRLYFHDKAKEMLQSKNPRRVDINILCDAIEFLAMEHWSTRYEGLSEDEMLNRCTKKYGRPFDVRPIGDMTVSSYPREYKIKYFTGHLGKKVESALNYHLAYDVGTERLIRIYYLYDDDKKLIVIGSLPDHLSTVTGH